MIVTASRRQFPRESGHDHVAAIRRGPIRALMDVEADSEQDEPPQQNREDGGEDCLEQRDGDIAAIPGDNKTDNDVDQPHKAKATSKHDLPLPFCPAA
jgi:hypothetical protein